jgi:hypothetical protein
MKITGILVCNQNFEKQKKWNSKIPAMHLLHLESMKYVKKKWSWCMEWVENAFPRQATQCSVNYLTQN